MPRGLLIFALCLPLAILMGFMLADPMMESNRMIAGGLLLALLIPILLTVHHRALIWSASAAIIVYVVPGQPHLWMVLAGLSFVIGILSRPLTKMRMRPVWDKLVLVSLIMLLVSVGITITRTGGLGMRVLGSSVYGGRKYAALIAAIIGFVALTLAVVPRRTAQRDVSIYVLGPITSAFSNFAYMLGPAFYFLFLLFPVDMALSEAAADFSPALVGLKRYGGFGPASQAVCMFCLLRWGIRGLCQIYKPWRALLFLAALFLGTMSGFRSALVLTFLVAFVQFFSEGLYRTKYVVGLACLVAAGIATLALFSDSLPLAAQRAISFLPVKVDPIAEADARNSLQWRFEMWRAVVVEIPEHLWFGKGYAIDPTDLYLAGESMRRGFVSDYELSIRAGDYHSGPLSVIVPFGVVGSFAIALFFFAAARTLYRNMRYGDPELRNINIFLFSFYTAKVIFFIVFFGGIEYDLWQFVAAVGIGLCVNGGPQGLRVSSRAKPQEERAVKSEPVLVTA
jgi:hypothetical protein